MLIKDAIVKRLQDICGERRIRYNELATRSGVTPLYGIQHDVPRTPRPVRNHP